MAQVENVADMQVGDHIVLPRGEWHVNPGAKAKYAEAQAITAARAGEDAGPQFQVQYSDRFNSILERIR